MSRYPLPPTKYVTTDEGFSIVYQQVGDTGPNLVWVTGACVAPRALLGPTRLGAPDPAGRFVQPPGVVRQARTGLSDRDGGTSSLEARMLDIGAVMDAVEMDTAVLVGMSEGAAMAALFAATVPERVERLVLVAGSRTPGRSRPANSSRSLRWSSGAVASRSRRCGLSGVSDTALLARIERAMGTPTSMAAMARANADFDVRPALPLIHAPTLVVH